MLLTEVLSKPFNLKTIKCISFNLLITMAWICWTYVVKVISFFTTISGNWFSRPNFRFSSEKYIYSFSYHRSSTLILLPTDKTLLKWSHFFYPLFCMGQLSHIIDNRILYVYHVEGWSMSDQHKLSTYKYQTLSSLAFLCFPINYSKKRMINRSCLSFNY